MITKIVNKISNLVWQNALLGRPRSLRILTYHGVVENYQDIFLERNFVTYKDFNLQLDFLTKHFKFISIDDILETKGNFSNEIAITFDDGYENNLIAAGILSKRKIPFTIFLTTSVLGIQAKSIWPVDLSLFLLKGSLNKIHLFNKFWDLNNSSQRKIIFKEIREILKKLKSQEKDKIFLELSRQYPENELEILHNRYTNFKMLSVAQAKELSSHHLCNLGSHGFQHELLHPNQDITIVEFEIKKSMEQFKDYFGYHPEFYGYPNGDSSPAAETVLRKMGFRAAFLNKASHQIEIKNNFLIPRLNVPNNLKVFKQKVNHY
jgi:peptidoglycan/xylan/chitin deacetylase (PgdA/CDA1 family)